MKASLLRERRDAFLILRQDSPEAESALAALLPDPDRLLEEGTIFKPGSRTHAGMVEIVGRRYFLKRYNCRGPIYRLRNAVRPSRAVHTWNLAWGLLGRQVPVPVPLVCLEERRFRLLGRSYVLMEAVAGQRLRETWPRLDERDKEQLLLRVGAILGRMHARGGLHGDLKWDNILVVGSGKETSLKLVDLDGGRLIRRPQRSRAVSDMKRFLQSLKEYEIASWWEDLLLESWDDAWKANG